MIKLDYLPYHATTNKSVRVGGVKPTYIVIHAMQGYYKGSISWFQNPKSQVSAHYLISKQGEICNMVKDELAAWHVHGFNSKSIGIELEDMVLKKPGNCLTDPKWCTPAELKAAAELVATLMVKHKIPLEHVIGHNDRMLAAPPYSANHKDPGLFPWDEFRQLIKGFLADGSKPK